MQKASIINLNLSKNTIFIIVCSKYKLTEDELEYIYSFILKNKNLDDLINLANIHGILPLLYKTIKALVENNNNSIINNFYSKVKTYYMSIVQKNMLMSSELIKIQNLFNINHINTLPFKGTTLSKIIYNDVTLRQFGDLDILIKQSDIKKITKLLEDRHYEKMYKFTPTQEKNWYRNAKDLNLIHKVKGTHIELHWLLMDRDYPIQIDLNSIWKNQQIIDVNGHKVNTFSNESLFIYLCIHGSKHLWERLIWIKDIDQLIRTQNLDWSYINQDLNKSNYKRMILLALHLSHTLFETPLPNIFQKDLNNQKWLNSLTIFVVENWEEPKNMFHNSKAMLNLFPNLTMKLLYIYKVIVKPSKNEYKFIDLPSYLYWGYYIIRPYLLLKKYFIKN